MIAPTPWQQHIAKLVTAIEKRANSRRISTTASMQLEKDLMIAFFLVHKLI
jgi:hypothetical protein